MSRVFLYITVFVTGLSVTAIELTASRFLAPFFGASIFIWANIIGVVLAALALGYYLGGKLSDKNPRSKPLYIIIFLTGIFTVLIPMIGKPLMRASFHIFTQSTSDVFLGSFVSVLALFVLPIVLLGMVSPWAAKLATRNLDTMGRTVGNLYSFSTIGSIAGVFLPVLVTIPYLGTAKTFFLFGAVLMVLGLIGLWGKLYMRLFILLPLIAVTFLVRPILIYGDDPMVLAEGESLYNTLHVREGPDKIRYMVMNEGRGVQSQFNPDKILSSRYWDAALLLPAFRGQPDPSAELRAGTAAAQNFLVIGVAGGTAIRTFQSFYPDIAIDGVEIDQKMIQFAKQYFDLKETEKVKLHVADGRIFLKQQTRKYNFIMVDAYTQELTIPFHIVTKEFFTELQNRLTEDGVVFVNVAAFSREPADNLISSAIGNTMASVFSYTISWWFPNTSSRLIFASQQPLPGDSMFIDKRIFALAEDFIQNREIVKYLPQNPVFIDDKAPIEMMSRIH